MTIEDRSVKVSRGIRGGMQMEWSAASWTISAIAQIAEHWWTCAI